MPQQRIIVSHLFKFEETVFRAKNKGKTKWGQLQGVWAKQSMVTTKQIKEKSK
uniref:Uncharacterized protein n=1 Tax=Physcomitrium patens TaxID=3218 RepID=A0A2K1JKM6_PHYPA|nr:hypothetical protein PHYPA_016937 [Physcomitrium patens]